MSSVNSEPQLSVGASSTPPVQASSPSTAESSPPTSSSSPSVASAASSSSSSSSSSDQVVREPLSDIPTKCKVLISDLKELDKLKRKWSKPIPTCQQIQDAGVANILLTKRSLDHIFGLTIEPQNRAEGSSFNAVVSSGFHYNASVNSQGKPNVFSECHISTYSRTKYVCEGWVSFKDYEAPKFKSMFKTNLSSAEVVDAWIESINNVKQVQAVGKPGKKKSKYQDQGPRMIIQGVSAMIGGLTITSVIKADTGVVVTFYPEPPSGITPQEIEKEAASRVQIYTKYFGNPSNLPQRAPLTEEEMEDLIEEGKDLQLADWKLVKVDVQTGEYYAMMMQMQNRMMNPYYQQTLVNTDFFEGLTLHPHQYEVQKIIPPLSIPESALRTVFADENRFPAYLQRMRILRTLRNALQNFVSDPFGDKARAAAALRLQAAAAAPASSTMTPYQHQQHTIRELTDSAKGGATMTLPNGQSIRMTVEMPHVTNDAEVTNGASRCISFNCESRGNSSLDRWGFRVTIDPDTGFIEKFGIRKIP